MKRFIGGIIVLIIVGIVFLGVTKGFKQIEPTYYYANSLRAENLID